MYQQQEQAPDEIDPQAQEEQQQLQIEQRVAKLDALGNALCKYQKIAVEGRTASGIEEDWLEDEDAFQGVDDANRAEEHASGKYRWRKPTSTSGTLTSSTSGRSPNESTIYMNITRSYTNAWASKISDMLLPADEFPFGLKAPPVPELVAASEAPANVMGPPGPEGQQVPLAQHANDQIEQANKCAEKAETRITDWLTECQFHGEARAMIDDVSRMGTGVLKGPIPMKRKQAVWDQASGSIKLNEEIKPGSKRVDPWNCFPDPLCGENIHDGSFFWERDDITGKVLRELKGTPGYIDFQIERCLTEGPQKSFIDSSNRPEQLLTDQTPFEIWYYHGEISREDLEAAGCDCVDMPEGETIALPAVVTMVNNRVVRATLNPLDNGNFPYDFMVCQARRGMPWGMGIPRQIAPAQKVLKAAWRAMLKNAGVSSGPQIVIFRDVVDPANGDWEITGGKIWYAKPGKDVLEVTHAFAVFNIESQQERLLAIIQAALKTAEDITGLPAILQGQQGSAPDLVGVVQILNNNASAVARRVARQFDFRIIEPHIQRYYEWLLQYGTDEEEKGLFIVDARGSSVLVERELQNQTMTAMVQLAIQPAYGADPRKAFAEFCKAHKITPERLQYSDAEWKTIQQNMAKQAPDPRIEAAKIQQQTAQQKMQGDQNIAQMQAQHDQALAQQQEKTDLLLAGIEAEIKSAEIAGRSEQALTNIKTKLADRLIQVHADSAAQAIDHAHEANQQAKEIAIKKTEGSGI